MGAVLSVESGQTNAPPTVIDPGTWNEAVAWLLRLSSSPTRVYRGQRDYSWTLRTRLGRDLSRLPPDRDRRSIENSVIGFFMDQAAGLLPTVPDEHDLLSWLSLMQHYRSANAPLLDWSMSPFVAAYFAYEQASGEDAALYALDTYFCRREFVTILPMPWDHLGAMAHSTTGNDGHTITRYPMRELYRRDRENELLRWAIIKETRWPLPTIPLNQDARMGGSANHLYIVRRRRSSN